MDPTVPGVVVVDHPPEHAEARGALLRGPGLRTRPSRISQACVLPGFLEGSRCHGLKPRFGRQGLGDHGQEARRS